SAFQEATHALDRGDNSEASWLYRKVLAETPQFTPALRRLAFALAGLGKQAESLALLEEAVRRERSPENLISLAQALAFPGPGKEGSRDARLLALGLVKEG